VRPAFMASLTLRTGKTYQLVKVQNVDSDTLTVSYRPTCGGWGMAKLAFKDLPSDLQLKYGYNPGATAQLPATERLLAVSIRTL